MPTIKGLIGHAWGSAIPDRPFKPVATERVTRATESSESNVSGNIPQAQVGVPVAAVLGRKRVPDANVIWTGNLRPLTRTTTSTTETKEKVVLGGTEQEITKVTTVTTTAIVGYLCDIHMGVCLGPDVHLLAIYVDNAAIWTGDIGPARTEITIDENDTFLSKSKVVFSGGAFDQAPDPDIDVADYPGYVGVATVLLKDVRIDLPMGNLSFEVVRIPNPLSLADATNKNSDGDINVVSALVEVMTNEWGYGGVDLSDVDITKYASMATTLKDEGNFCSIKIGSEISVAAVIKALQAQAMLVVFQNPETGLITGQLVRETDIDYVNSPKFYEQNIIEFRNYGKTGWQDAVEQVRGVYTERDADYNPVPIFLPNFANVPLVGRQKKTATIEYPYVSTAELCQALLSRDLAFMAGPVYGFSLVTKRDGANRLPGDIVLVTWPDYDFLNVPMLVNRVRKQDINSNNVVLTLSQMKLPTTSAIFNPAGGGIGSGFDLSAMTPLNVKFITAPYFIARARHAITSAETSPLVYPLILPKPANDMQFSFSAFVSNAPNASGDTQIIEAGLFPTFGKLDGAILKYDGYADGELAGIIIDGVINPANLISVGEAGVRNGRVFLIIDDEILSFEGATDNGGGSWTLTNVHRGLLDTVPAAHANDADCYIINNNFNFVGGGADYPLGYVPSWIVTSNTLIETGLKDDGLVSTGWAPSAVRTLAPPRPHNTKVNGLRDMTPTQITEGDNVTVSWTPRARTNSGVALQLDSADTLETGQQFKVYLRDSTDTDTLLGTTAGASLTVAVPAVADGVGSIFVRSELTLGGATYASLQDDLVPVEVLPAP